MNKSKRIFIKISFTMICFLTVLSQGYGIATPQQTEKSALEGNLDRLVSEATKRGQENTRQAQEILQASLSENKRSSGRDLTGGSFDGLTFNVQKDTQRDLNTLRNTLLKQSPNCAHCQDKSFIKEKATEGETLNKGLKSKLLIFVSGSMPIASLKALFQQAQSVGGKLIFRGLIENSFQKTKVFFEEHKLNVEIDPRLFEEHQVKQVPTFILKDKDLTDRVEGNISVHAALEMMAQKGALKKKASSLLVKNRT